MFDMLERFIDHFASRLVRRRVEGNEDQQKSWEKSKVTCLSRRNQRMPSGGFTVFCSQIEKASALHNTPLARCAAGNCPEIPE